MGKPASSERKNNTISPASVEGRGDVVKLLLARGSNVNTGTAFGHTALMFASRYGFTDIARTLLEKGAEINQVPEDKTGWPALIVATQRGHLATVRLLLEHGADVALPDHAERTALDWALQARRPEIAKLLKRHGAKESDPHEDYQDD